MNQDFSHIIQSGKDGQLDTNSPREHVAELVRRAASAGKPIVLHLHGGLVKAEAAYAMINSLQPRYTAAGLFPVFIVWRTGLLDAVKNAGELVDKPLFDRLLRLLLPFLVGKLDGVLGRGSFGAAPQPGPAEVNRELQRRPQGGVPFDHVKTSADNDNLTPQEEEQLTKQINADEKLKQEWEREVVAAADGPATPEAAISPPPGPPLDKPVANHAAGEDAAGGKAALSTVLAQHAVKIAARVVRRFHQHSDHGLHATLVEEILRELFVDAVGSAVWGFMKTDAADTFDHAGQTPERAGWLFLQLLAEETKKRRAEGQPAPSLSIVAHSAGSIYACHLLEHLAQARLSGTHPFGGTDFQLKRLVFLAPACTCELFSSVLALHAHPTAPLFHEFRIFALSDADERGYYEVFMLYPASLLYLVSALFEDPAGAGISDAPLVGMERYYREVNSYRQPAVAAVKEFLSGKVGQVVLSGEDRGDGWRCDARRHGGFDDFDHAPETVKSFLYFLSQH